MSLWMFWSSESSNGRAAAAVGAEQRKHPRLATDAVTCALGDVVDLSGAGMRLACRGKPLLQIGQRAQVRLVFARGNLVVGVQARWLRRRGIRRYEMGLAFVGLSAAAERALANIAQFGFIPAGGTGNGSATPPRVRATVDLPDYYTIMGVEPAATLDDIRHAYRALARIYHPDTTTDPEGEVKFMRIREAYEVLVDADQRGVYDLQRAGATARR